MGRFLIFVGLVLLGLDRLAGNRGTAPLALGLIVGGGFLHLRERRV